MSLPSLHREPLDQSPPTTPFSDPSLASLKRGHETVNGVMVRRHIPTPIQVRQIETHIATLKSRLNSSASRREIGVELAKLLALFPTQAQSEMPSDLRMEGYFEGLIGLPLWAIRQAREKVVKGETNLDTRFAPTPPQFASLVRAMMQPAERDLATLEQILARTEERAPSPAEQTRVAAGFDRLVLDLKCVPPSAA